MLQPELVSAVPEDNYKLILVYETGEKRLFDVKPYISGSWFGELKNPDIFKTVTLKNHTVEWAGGQDISPHELYRNSVDIK